MCIINSKHIDSYNLERIKLEPVKVHQILDADDDVRRRVLLTSIDHQTLSAIVLNSTLWQLIYAPSQVSSKETIQKIVAIAHIYTTMVTNV